MVISRLKEELSTKEDIKSILRVLGGYAGQLRMMTTPATKISKWSRGKLYGFENGELFLFPTNLPSVSYLNLEEFAKKNRDVVGGISSQFQMISDQNLLEPDFKVDSFFGDMAEEVMDIHLRYYYSVLETERDIHVLLSLLEDWDFAKFMRLAKRCLTEDALKCHIHEVYLQMLIHFCSDSLDVVEVVAHICREFSVTYLHDLVRNDMTPYEYIFFRYHLDKMNVQQSVFERTRDLPLEALKTGNVKLMKIALELEWPSLLLPKRGQALALGVFYNDFGRWPRAKNGLHRKSFNSLEFYAALGFFAVCCAWKHSRTRRLQFVRCFRLLWRALPTPYLPIRDIRQGVSLRRVARVCRLFDREEVEPRIWTILAEAFEEDFPHQYKPRRLKHLSRHAVRRRYRSPEAISTLVVPDTLKQYLLLES